MKHLLRALTLAAVAGTALALTGSAFAAFTTPRLTVNTPTAGSLTIGYTQTKEDDALNRLQIYIPTGYTASTSSAPGATIGAVTAVVQANAISADAIVPLEGTIRVDSPAAHNSASDVACRQGATASAVWVLVLQSPAGPLEVPVHVIAASGPETAFASAKLVLCLPSPYIPQAAGGAALGAKVINAQMTVAGGLITAPASGGVWRGIATPYTVGAATPNVPGTREIQAIVAPPATLTATRVVRGRNVTVAGRLRRGATGVNGATVQLLRGTRVLRTARTSATGVYAMRVRLPKGTYTLRTRSTVPAQDLGAPGCVTAISAAPCLGATTSGFRALSPVIRFRVR